MSASQEVPTPPPRPKTKIRVFRANRYGQIFVREEQAEEAPPQRCAGRSVDPSGGDSEVVERSFAHGDAVVDTANCKVGKIHAINGECLVLIRSVGAPWDALKGSCRPATAAEAKSLTGFPGHTG